MQDAAIASVVTFASRHPTRTISLVCDMIGYENLWRALFSAFGQKVLFCLWR